MYIACDPMFSEMMKHMEIGYHFVRDKVAVGLVSAPFVLFSSQSAYVLTKAPIWNWGTEQTGMLMGDIVLYISFTDTHTQKKSLNNQTHKQHGQLSGKLKLSILLFEWPCTSSTIFPMQHHFDFNEALSCFLNIQVAMWKFSASSSPEGIGINISRKFNAYV